MYATPRATLDFFTYAQRICAINSSRDKNSCRSFAKLSAWCVRAFGTFFILSLLDVLQQMRIANREKDVGYLAFAVLRK